MAQIVMGSLLTLFDAARCNLSQFAEPLSTCFVIGDLSKGSSKPLAKCHILTADRYLLAVDERSPLLRIQPINVRESLVEKGIFRLLLVSMLHFCMLLIAEEYDFQLFMAKPKLAFFAKIVAMLGSIPSLVNVIAVYHPSPLYFLRAVGRGETMPVKRKYCFRL